MKHVESVSNLTAMDKHYVETINGRRSSSKDGNARQPGTGARVSTLSKQALKRGWQLMGRQATILESRGIPVKVQADWLLIVVLIPWLAARKIFPEVFPAWGALELWIASVFITFLFFSSVLAHEFGHALAAQAEGIRVSCIVLFSLGGMAHIEYEPRTPRSEFRIVAAGPFANLVLGALFFIIGWAARLDSPLVYILGIYLAEVNLMLAAFNLLPAYPMDGGRLLRAALWYFNHPYQQATVWAAGIGQLIAIVLAAGGVYILAAGQGLAAAWLIFIAGYLFATANIGYRQARAAKTAHDRVGVRLTLAIQRRLALVQVTQPARLPFATVVGRPGDNLGCGLKPAKSRKTKLAEEE